jgi:mitochondrial splicing suppressor protein 51
MSTKYTCNRCLAVLRSSRRAVTSPACSLTPMQHRWQSSTSRSSLAKPAIAPPRRQSSSLGHQQHQVPPSDEPYISGRVPTYEHKPDGSNDLSRLILTQDNLFHPLSRSPIPSMRQRAAYIKAHAFCSHPSHTRTRIAISEDDPEARKPVSGGLPPAHVSFECPDWGIPVSCSEEHWAEDYEEHLQVCDTLRQVNEDDHDLRSGRYMQEFQFPGTHHEEALVNLTNWDTLLYTRGFDAINQDRKLRQATKVLTYPVTVGSLLHELSPFNIRKGGRLTVEGLKSFSGKSRQKYCLTIVAKTKISKPFAITSIHPFRAPALGSKACDPTRLPCASS